MITNESNWSGKVFRLVSGEGARKPQVKGVDSHLFHVKKPPIILDEQVEASAPVLKKEDNDVLTSDDFTATQLFKQGIVSRAHVQNKDEAHGTRDDNFFKNIVTAGTWHSIIFSSIIMFILCLFATYILLPPFCMVRYLDETLKDGRKVYKEKFSWGIAVVTSLVVACIHIAIAKVVHVSHDTKKKRSAST